MHWAADLLLDPWVGGYLEVGGVLRYKSDRSHGWILSTSSFREEINDYILLGYNHEILCS